MINTEEIKIKSFNREAEGRKLVIFAWIIEVVAIVIGLSIGVSAALIGIEQTGTSLMENINFSVAAIGPFIAFAACELAKIPTAKGLYTSQGWTKKTICLVLLSFFAVLTFETIYQGMEQNISSRIAGVQQFKGELTYTEEEIEISKEEILTLSNADSISASGKVTELNEIENKNISLKLAAIESRREDSISFVETKYDGEISLVQSSIDSFKEEINNLDKNEQKAEGWRNRKTKDQIMQRKEPLIAALSKQKSILENLRIDKRKELDQIYNTYIEERGPIDKQIAENRKRLDENEYFVFEKANQNEQRREEIQLNLNQLIEKAQDLREELLIAANSNSVYRIAMSFSSVEHPADLPNEIVDIVGNIWVISISLMTAVAGSVLAFIGVSMQEDRPKKRKEKPKPSKISRAIRSMLIDARRKLRSPKILIEKQEVEVERVVEITKEVPVEKVVIQEKEVEVEKVITRVVGVPVPTPPKDLPTAEEIDKETEAERLLDLQDITSIGEPAHA